MDLWVAGKGPNPDVNVHVDVSESLDSKALPLGQGDISLYSPASPSGEDHSEPVAHRVVLRPSDNASPDSLEVEAGVEYFLIARVSGGQAKWCMAEDVYAGGTGFVSTDAGMTWTAKLDDDRTFRIYLDIPREEL